MGKIAWHNWGKNVEMGLLWLTLIMLPWQLRHTLMFAEVNGGYFEYGSWQLYASDVAMLLLIVVGLIVGGRKMLRPLPSKISLPLLSALVWMTVTVTWAVDKPAVLMTAAHWWLMMLWCTYLVNRVKRWEEIIWPLLVGAVIQAGVGMAQYSTNHSLGLNWLGESVLDPIQPGASVVELDGFRKLRAYGLMPHPNLLGGWLAAILAMTGLLAAELRKRWQWWLMLGMTVVITLGAVWSFSRIAWLAIAAVVLVLMYAGWRVRQTKWLWLAAVIGLSAGIALAVQPQYVGVRFTPSANLEQQSLQERKLGFEYWRKIVSQNPNLGVGLDNYAINLVGLEPGQGSWWYAPVHNIYLLWTAELGSFGMAIWVWAIAAIMMWVWQRKHTIGVWLASLPLAVWLILGVTDHWPVSLQQGQILLFLALALIILASKRMIGTEQEE